MNNDCGAVSAVGKASAFLARRSVTATDSTPVLAVELVLCSASDSLGGRRKLGGFIGEEMRTRNQVETADRLAESSWKLALCELFKGKRSFY